MVRVPIELREHILAFWRGHSEAWKLSGLTQRDYCERHNISLKNFGNWRAQLKRVALAGPDARWGRYPELRKDSPRVNPRAKTGVSPRATRLAPAPVPPPGARRQFSEELKERIVAEASRPGASASDIARRYGLDLRLLRRWRRVYGAEPSVDQVVGSQP